MNVYGNAHGLFENQQEPAILCMYSRPLKRFIQGLQPALLGSSLARSTCNTIKDLRICVLHNVDAGFSLTPIIVHFDTQVSILILNPKICQAEWDLGKKIWKTLLMFLIEACFKTLFGISDEPSCTDFPIQTP